MAVRNSSFFRKVKPLPTNVAFSMAESIERLNGGAMGMLKCQGSVDRTRTCLGTPSETEKLLITSPIINMVLNRLADFVTSRGWTFVGGDEKLRGDLIEFFKCINMTALLRHFTIEGNMYGKGVAEVVHTSFDLDSEGNPKLKADKTVNYQDVNSLKEKNVKPVSAQVVKEVYHRLGYVRYYEYVKTNTNNIPQDDSKDKIRFERDEVAIYYAGKLTGREYGSSFLNTLTFTLDSINRCDINLNVMTDKYAVGFYQLIIDPVYLDKFTDGVQLVKDIKTVMNDMSSGQNVFNIPGTEVKPTTFPMQGMDSILNTRKNLYDEVCMLMGFSPALVRGERDTFTPMELARINGELKSLEGFFNTELVPKLLKESPFGLPKLQFESEIDTKVKESKADIMDTGHLPETRKAMVEKRGAEYDPEYDKEIPPTQPATPTNQVDSKTGGEIMDKTNQKDNVLPSGGNILGSKKKAEKKIVGGV